MKRIIGFSVVDAVAAGRRLRRRLLRIRRPRRATSPCRRMAPDEHTVYAPMAPPPMQAEMIPPPPNGQAKAVYWVPGNWKWYGTADGHSGWQWTAGHYVARPNSNVAWQPGHWQQSNNGYFWVDGYWQ